MLVNVFDDGIGDQIAKYQSAPQAVKIQDSKLTAR